MASAKQYDIPQQLMEFVTDATIVVRSPGRINLIGEHTDYNNGFVLPAEIDKAVYVAIEKRSDGKLSLFSVDFNESVEVELTAIRPKPASSASIWSRLRRARREARLPLRHPVIQTRSSAPRAGIERRELAADRLSERHCPPA